MAPFSPPHNPSVVHFLLFLGGLPGDPLLLMSFKRDGLPVITVLMMVCATWRWV